ncbi:MAG: contact-dependent growth inhibition system immunity protein [Sciscionella sp.]
MATQQPRDDMSLEQIEDDVWGDAPDEATHLVATVHRLRRKPIGALTAEDLRMLVNQKEGVDVLVPRALDRLAQEPLLEGDFFPGDVLTAVLRVPASYWSAHPELLAKLDRIITSIDDPDADIRADIAAFRNAIGS